MPEENSSEIKINTEVQENSSKKFEYLQTLYQYQQKIDEEISEISSEIKTIPQSPLNMDAWISSFSSKFKISDLSKMVKLTKRYKILMEERQINGSKMKLFAIDNLLEQIKETEKTKDEV